MKKGSLIYFNLIKTLTKKACQKLIPTFLSMIESLKDSPFKHLATLGKTFDKWKDEIACMWRFSKSNGRRVS